MLIAQSILEYLNLSGVVSAADVAFYSSAAWVSQWKGAILAIAAVGVVVLLGRRLARRGL